jgi:hypothetical protein
MCEWDSRARSQHWQQKHWTTRMSLKPGSKNILLKRLVDPKKILLPPLHIKLGIIKQFLKTLPKMEIVSNTFAKVLFVGSQTKRRCFRWS